MIACYEVPGFGGASTSAYELFRTMQSDGVDVSFVNLIDERDRVFFQYTFGDRLGNPDGLAGVENVFVAPPFSASQPGLTALRRIIDRQAPDVAAGVGHVATSALRAAAPQGRLVYMTTGCKEAERLILEGRYTDYVSLARGLPNDPRMYFNESEWRAISNGDLVITHSDQVRDLLLHFYPEWKGKIYPCVIWYAEWIHSAALRHAHRARPFHEREIDALFIASSWDRKVKNYALVRRIVSRLPGRRIHVVGDVDESLAGVVHHGFVPERERVLDLLGNARAVVCPSLVDAAPGILFEASALGCNVVASKNCGSYRLCHPALLVDPPTLEGFVSRITLAQERRLDDRMADFLGSGSYSDLVDTLMAL